MKRFSILLLLSFFQHSSVWAQIFEKDSMVKTIAYWDLNESYSYSVSLDNYNVVGSDTMDRSLTTYLVDVTVIDSTEHSYVMRWEYRNMNFQFFLSDSLTKSLLQKMMEVSGGTVLEIQTDELGVFKEVRNWEAIRDYYLAMNDSIKHFFGNVPEINGFVDRMMAVYLTKAGIENGSIKDVFQFLNFHGGELQLGSPVFNTMKFPDSSGQHLMDALATLELIQIYPEDDDYSVYSKIEINPDQLKVQAKLKAKALYPETTDSQIDDVFNQLGELWSVIENSSVIHRWGWPLYSKEIRTSGSKVKSEVEIRIMELITS